MDALTQAESTTAGRLHGLEDDSQLADVVFRVGMGANSSDFPALGALFAAQSPYFKSLLYGRMREAQPVEDMACALEF